MFTQTCKQRVSKQKSRVRINCLPLLNVVATAVCYLVMDKTICFDVLGTLFTWDPTIAEIQKLLDKNGIKDNAHTIMMLAFYGAQRDFTYRSMVGSYMPIVTPLKGSIRRSLKMAKVPVTDEDLKPINESILHPTTAPGVREAIPLLHEKGYKLYAVTNGAEKTTWSYIDQAGLRSCFADVLSCDNITKGAQSGVAKPDMTVYEKAWISIFDTPFQVDKSTTSSSPWFVAAHQWDLFVAKKAGFRTGFVTYEEFDDQEAVYGKPDISSADMLACAEYICSSV